MPARDHEKQVWGALAMELPGALHGDITARLGNLTLGSESSASGSSLRIYLRSPEQAEGARALLERLLSECGLEAGDCAIRVESVKDGRWVENYQAALAPIRIGSRFEVHPAGDLGARDGLLPLRLIPGRAFGTGEHPTTRLCVRLLERRVRRGSRWLDLGCGSAILAMVSHHCGATRILALDSDPEAVEVAREVLGANGLSDLIELRAGSIEACEERSWDGIVANISAYFTRPAAREIAARLAAEGVLIASGFERPEADEIARRLERAGLRTESRMTEGEWAAIVAVKGVGAE